MSVAENAPVTTGKTPRNTLQTRAVGSLLGAVYVLVGLWIVFAGLPYAWGELLHVHINEFLSATLLMMLAGLVAVGIGYVGYQLMRNQHQPGLRAGIFFAAVLIFVSVWIALAVGRALDEQHVLEGAAGGIVTIGILALLLVGTVFLFLQPAWGNVLESVESQNWFDSAPFKASQGIRVRRGTVVGVLTLGICGIYTLISHRTFGFEARDLPANDWFWNIPFTGSEPGEPGFILPLMYKVHVLMPVILAIALLYFAWRLVNVPVFADFLIATEAEMNKVSWTTRRRLIQDTIVVLVTVGLLTLFLFAVDIMWIKILSNPYVGVLLYDTRAAQQKQQEKNQW